MDTNIEHVQVAIVGAGPGGVGAAGELSRRGIGPIAVIEREPRVGGIPGRYTSDEVPTYVMWTSARVLPGHRYAERLQKELEGTGVSLHLESLVTGLDAETGTLTIVSPGKGRWRLQADAILLACGARESSRVERGWIYGHRPAGVYFTSNLLDLADKVKQSAADDAAVIGSEVISYATAAKLAEAGAKTIRLADDAPRPRCLFPKRVFFARWAWPQWIDRAGQVSIRGHRAVEALEFSSGKSLSVQEVAVTGRLVPNSELIAEAGLPIDALSRRAGNLKGYRLGETGIFVAGGILGLNSCSGQWAYFTGKWAARSVARFLAAKARG